MGEGRHGELGPIPTIDFEALKNEREFKLQRVE